MERGRKPEYPEETPEARGEHANSTHKAEAGIKPPTLETLAKLLTSVTQYKPPLLCPSMPASLCPLGLEMPDHRTSDISPYSTNPI
ncbi:hypothetical protein QTP86_005803 [Hemibagrus guttatus]|nr:hypothetical protein QTP86_005803 [Hemibagrus guttatus]